MVEAVVAKLDGNRPVVSAPEFQRKLPILEIPIGKISRIGPVVAGVCRYDSGPPDTDIPCQVDLATLR